MTLVWVSVKDFNRIGKYEKDGLVKKQKTTFVREWIILAATKVFYLCYMVVIPLMVLSGYLVAIPHWLSGDALCRGFILGIIFQPAHVIDGTEYPLPDDDGKMENSWAIHQLHTTTNFGHDNAILSWYCGGLNFQVEHHLFPNVCHVHYRNIASIVKQTAEEFELPLQICRYF